MAENPHGLCLKPSSNGIASLPRDGCAFWRREPGTDDRAGPPAGFEEGSPERERLERQRARLVRIQEIAIRDAKLPMHFHVYVADLSGRLVVDGPVLMRDRLLALQDQVDRLGVSVAIRTGRI